MDTVLCGVAQSSSSMSSPDAMDPLLAAFAHNQEFSLLLKLPDEILLAILQFLQSDTRDIYYLRRVCRKLRSLSEDRFLDPGLFWGGSKSRASHMLHHDRFTSRENNRLPFWSYSREASEFKANIRKQTLCEPCQTALRGRTLVSVRGQCAFVETPTQYIRCAGCHSKHPRNAFSHTQRRKDDNERICIGREGRLRLCEHVSFTWADITAHLTAASKKRNFYKAVSDFHIACKHPSHNFACKSTSRHVPSEASCNDHTRPCARLQIEPRSSLNRWTYISLVLCWKPYSSSKILTAADHGEIEVTRLRELYGEYARNAARFIVPGPSQNPMPEMLCFDPEKCRHIFYRNGVRPQATHYKQPSTLQRSCQKSVRTEAILDRYHQDASRFTGLGWPDHYVEFEESRGQSGIYVYECDEKHDGQGPTRCLMTSYRRTISLGHIDHGHEDHCRRWALNPSHEWFHAVDQDSFPSIQEEGRLWSRVRAYIDGTKSRPRCRDASCRNYYKSPGPLHSDFRFFDPRKMPSQRTKYRLFEFPDWTQCAVYLLHAVLAVTLSLAVIVVYYLW